MPRPDDYAVLVGIQEYPGAGFGSLSGPVNDVAYFERWLVDKDGGDVDPTHIVKLITQKPSPAVLPDVFPPTRNDIETAIRQIVFNGAGIVQRPNGRLYLYFSGHGFSDFKEKSVHAAVYAANAQPGISSSVCGTKVAQWCKRAAAFGEIILVMDCCRDVELSKQMLPPPFDDIHDPALEKGVRLLEIYAVPYGHKAQERYFNDVQNQHGLLTYALVAALYGAPLEKSRAMGNKAVRSGHALKDFMEGCWPDIAGDNGPEAPEFVLPTRLDIALSTMPPRALPRRISFVPPVAGMAELKVVDSGDQKELVRIDLDAVAGSALYYYAGAPAPLTRTFNGNAIEVELPPQLYELVLEQGDAEPRNGIMPMVGDQDVKV